MLVLPEFLFIFIVLKRTGANNWGDVTPPEAHWNVVVECMESCKIRISLKCLLKDRGFSA
jgi:hypothetical protein